MIFQGHSRTIVGVEILKNGDKRLLIFDPSHQSMARLLTNQEKDCAAILKSMRKSSSGIKSRQYQIVAIKGGRLQTEQEINAAKIIRSTRIPK